MLLVLVTYKGGHVFHFFVNIPCFSGILLENNPQICLKNG